MKQNKEVRITYNKVNESWIIRYWSNNDNDWNIDSSYPIKDKDKNDIGWISEYMLCRIYELKELGYTINFM